MVVSKEGSTGVSKAGSMGVRMGDNLKEAWKVASELAYEFSWEIT